jgi:hypothetical protein
MSAPPEEERRPGQGAALEDKDQVTNTENSTVLISTASDPISAVTESAAAPLGRWRYYVITLPETAASSCAGEATGESAAAQRSRPTIQDLLQMQEEYQEWRDGLPENLQASALGEKLEAVTGIDLESALAAAEEADGADLPLGFGRD